MRKVDYTSLLETVCVSLLERFVEPRLRHEIAGERNVCNRKVRHSANAAQQTCEGAANNISSTEHEGQKSTRRAAIKALFVLLICYPITVVELFVLQ